MKNLMLPNLTRTFINWSAVDCNYSGHVISEFRGRHGFLSNYHVCQFEIDGVVFQSSEHAFHYFKTNNAAQRERIRCTPTAHKSKRVAQYVTLRPNWNAVRDSYMLQAMWAKFSQNEDLKAKLLKTGDALLIEGNDWKDDYWGACRNKDIDWYGYNHVGQLLMYIREQLRTL